MSPHERLARHIQQLLQDNAARIAIVRVFWMALGGGTGIERAP